MATPLTSVASAAIIGGDLIMGLSDGSIINCGRVQGPQGLTGPQGPMGATGRDGQDGNTIHTVEGAPDGSLGRDGDYAINVVVWEIYGPRSGGVWGTGTPLRGNARGGQSPETTQNLFGSNSGSDAGTGGRTYSTGNLPNSGQKAVGAGNITPAGSSFTYQQNINDWLFSALEDLDTAVPVKKVDSLPAAGEYDGEMVYMSGALYIWLEGAWQSVGASESDTDALAALSLKVGRVEDNVDFTQNTVGKGQWVHRKAGGKAYPDPGEFFTKEDKIDFGEIEEFIFNDVGLPGITNPGTLQNTRIGDYLIVQVDNTNNFGYYVIIGTTTENIDDQHLLRTFTVKPFRDARYKGETVFNSRCTVATTRPIYTIVQDDQPLVSERGVLWYRESDDHLFISNYGDGFIGEGPQWTDLTAGGEGQYLPLTGGTIDGELRVNKPNGEPIFEVTADKVELLKHATSIDQLAPKEIINVGILDNLMRDPGQYGYLKDYLPLAGGSMTGNIAMNGHTVSGLGDPNADAQAANRRYVDTRLKRTGGTQQKMEGILYLGGNRIAGVGDPERSDDAATRGYVDQKVAEGGGGGGTGAYLPLSGGTLNGNLEMSGGYIKCLNGQPTSWFDQSGNWAAEFKGKGDKTFQMVSAQGVSIEWTGRSNNDVSIPGVKFDPRLMQWEFCNVKEPEASSDVATRKYVDEQVVAAQQTWAPTKFKFKDGGTITTINPGEFYIGQSEGERALVIHRKAADGVDWSFFESGVDWKQDFNGPCSVRKIDGTIVFQADTVQMVTYGTPADRRHVLLKTLNSRRPIDLVNNEEYVIYIPGILPRFILS